MGKLLIWHFFKLMFSKFVQKRTRRRSYIKGRADVSGSTQRSSFSNKFSFGSKHIYLPRHNKSPDFKMIQPCLEVILSPPAEPQARLIGGGCVFCHSPPLVEKCLPSTGRSPLEKRFRNTICSILLHF